MLRWLLRRKLAQEEQRLGGTCLQIGVNLARESGVSPQLLQSVLDGRLEDLPAELVDVFHFTQQVVTATGDEDELRETLRQRYGERGLIELAYAITSSQIPPTVKRCLGYARSCRLVHVEVGH